MKISIIAAVLAAPAMAETVTAENCTFPIAKSSDLITCDFTNHTDQAVASFSYATLITQKGRAVPWVDTNGDRPSRWLRPISGGLEPQETLNLVVTSKTIPERADLTALQISVTPYDAINAAGEIIPD